MTVDCTEPNVQTFQVALTGAETANQVVFPRRGLGFRAKSARVYNTSGHTFLLGSQAVIPPSSFEFWFKLTPALDNLDMRVYTAGSIPGDCWITLTEEEVPPTALTLGGGGGSSAVAAQPLGAANHTSSIIPIAGGVGSLGARATRTAFVLVAPVANAADIVLTGGVHIAPGGTFQGTARDVVNLTGTNGDTLQVYEEYN